MHRTAGPQDVVVAARAARERLHSVGRLGESSGSRDEWADALRELQSLVDTASAAQDAAMVRLAAVEPEVLETGEVVETHRAPGHVALDAPAIVSGVLCLTAVTAERRVRAAARLAADGPPGTATATGLGGLHDAMAAGRLDGYRAGVVAYELEEVPAEVAATVVAGLADRFPREDASRLRRRVRRLLGAISPDLVRQRAVRTRAGCRLERWVGEPGVDTWHGTFPSEDAAAAWSLVDDLARQYVADGVRDDLGRARAKALTDLVTRNARVDIQVITVTPLSEPGVPSSPPFRTPAHPDDLVEVHGLRPGEPSLVARSWLTAAAEASRTGNRSTDPTPAVVHPGTGALLDPDDELATDAYRPGRRLAALVRARDGRCRFPGCHVAARFCDLDHARPWPAGPTSAANLVCLCRRHHRVKQRPGWRVRLDPDGTATWTDPTGLVRSTLPVDLGALTVLPHRDDEPPPPPPGNPRLVLPDGPHSRLEHALEHLPGCRTAVLADLRRHGVQVQPVARPLRYDGGCRTRAQRPPPPDLPPF
ncbi:HNH endonuclease signature motif containing protein [Phycicoccus flavus]|uniref:HNH endonuclease n=1 Tax=Phycicoccus flavus TaxID=2502783 RepID=A0A8T6QZW1_9MICO|nr:HNH endonuclease signature motif containing protein [Phycicoccus flavus]NHA67217.1 HNH endonuclease [Phycicoccus flavus]